MRLKAALMVAIAAPGKVRTRSVLERAAAAQRAQAVHDGEVGARGLKHAAEEGHVGLGLAGLADEVVRDGGEGGLEFAVEHLAGERKLLEAVGIEQGKGAGGLGDQSLELGMDRVQA